MAPVIARYLNYSDQNIVVGQEYTLKLEETTLTVIRHRDNCLMLQAKLQDKRWQAISGESSMEFYQRTLELKQNLQQLEASHQTKAAAKSKPSTSRDSGRE